MIVQELFNFLRREDVWRKSDQERVELLYEHLKSLHDSQVTENSKAVALKRISAFNSKIKERWQKSSRKEGDFLRKNSSWLQNEVTIFTPSNSPALTPTGKRGRPNKNFDECSVKSKLRKTSELRKIGNTGELLFAAYSSLRSEGDRSGAKLLHQGFLQSSKTNSVSQTSTSYHQYTGEEAVSLVVQNRLTKEKYKNLRETALANGVNLYPSYDVVRKAKTECYPPSNSVTITEFSAEISLQSLLDLTTKRLLLTVEPVLLTMEPDHLLNLTLICKWGSDGSTGYTIHKQVSTNPDVNDSSLYVTSVVPLQLYSFDGNGRKIIVWQNPHPSSPRYCRPLKLQFVKETTELILREANSVQKEIESLSVMTSLISPEKPVNVSYSMFMTMIDGKVCNALTNTKSSQSCNVCGAKPSQMNDLNAVLLRKPNEDVYKLGLSTLHCWIRTFEFLLHVSYKLDNKQWQAKSIEEKESVEMRKRSIQRDFKKQLGLIVDQPKQGFGSSNDGNTARAFFLNYDVSSQITGLDKTLIHRFSVLLRVLACGYEINLQAFKDYAVETARITVNLYPWYPLPPTVHKYLIHGAAIIEAAPLPIGALSEDAQESRHKDCKYAREFHTRKISRVACITDLMNFLLLSSDPKISGLRKLAKKNAKSLVSEVLALLKEPSINPALDPISTEDLSEEE